MLGDREFLLFDGGMGTMMQTAGLMAGEVPERWNLERSDDVLKIHKAYVEAGADVVSANTFGANSYKLPSDLKVADVVKAAINIAKSSGAKYVAQDIGPIGSLLEPLGTLPFEEAYRLYQEQVLAGEEAGADLYIIETMTDLLEAKAALLAVKENSNRPVIVSMSYAEDGRTFLGTTPEAAAYTLCGLGADAVGVNCSLGPRELLPITEKLCRICTVPVIVQANAGLPQLKGGETVYDIDVCEYTSYVAKMLDMGVTIIGGCCGTTPEYIRALKKLTLEKQIVERHVVRRTVVTSGQVCVIPDDGICVIGERINPTGKSWLKAALREARFEVLAEEAISQQECGAGILDVNVGIPDIDEVKTLTRAVRELQAVTTLPLQLDSSNAKAVEAAARVYNGLPMINSVNGKEESMSEIFPIAKKYGAVVVALTLDENGIPDTAEGRLDIAKRIVKCAEEYGIPRESIVVDCLVMTAATEQRTSLETLRAVRMVREQLGLHTVLGVSNISFGLPNRELFNSTFLASAFACGLDMPILNPKSTSYMNVIDCYRVLNNEDKDAAVYIENHAGDVSVGKKSSGRNGGRTEQAAVEENVSASGEKAHITHAILTGRRAQSAELTRQLLMHMSVMDVINDVFIPALDEVGRRYESGKLFLPQLMASAETVKNGFDVLREQESGGGSKKGETILLATVKGDIHDIGKNIVKMLLENYGYNIIDLGRDVPPELVVQTVLEHNVRLVGLSALMTTTVKYMEDTVLALREACPDCRIMVGGAVLTAEYAKKMGADYYAKDAAESARIAGSVFGRKD